MAWRVECLAQSALTPVSGSEHPEDTLALVSAASNGGACLVQPLRAANPVGLDGEPLLPKAAEARLKQLALDLLGLHFAISQLQGELGLAISDHRQIRNGIVQTLMEGMRTVSLEVFRPVLLVNNVEWKSPDVFLVILSLLQVVMHY